MTVLKKQRKLFKRLRKRVIKITNHPLTKDKPIGAVKRYAKFHLVHKLLPGAAVYPFVNDLKILTRPGMGYVAHNIYVGLGDYWEMGFVLHFLRSADVFVDVGANAGAYTLLAAGVCQAAAIAIEPVPETYKLLQLNLKLNNLEDKVECMNIGAGDATSRLHFSIDKPDAWNRVVIKPEEMAKAIVVDVYPLDQIVEKACPALLKIDVEGYDFAVLKGATNILQNPGLKAVMVELNKNGRRFGFSETDIHKLLLDAGFQPYAYDPMTRKLTQLSNYNQKEENTLYLRDLNFLRDRVENAAPFHVLGKDI